MKTKLTYILALFILLVGLQPANTHAAPPTINLVWADSTQDSIYRANGDGSSPRCWSMKPTSPPLPAEPPGIFFKGV